MTDTGATPTPRTTDALLARLRAELPNALSTALTASGFEASAGNDLYEAYLFALVLRAARSEGYSVEFANGNGLSPDVFRLRRSPGRLPTGSQFTYAILSLPDGSKDPLEVHTGVAVIGKSKVAHEADVLVLPHFDAERCRQLRIDPPSHVGRLVVEGKYYSTPVSLGIGRQFLGLTVDLSAKHMLLAATVTSSSVVHLLEGRSKSYEVGVLPGRKAEGDLQARIAIALRSYRQRA